MKLFIMYIQKGILQLLHGICLLYTSDAADERSSVDLGGRRIIKKKNTIIDTRWRNSYNKKYQEQHNENESKHQWNKKNYTS